MREVLNAIRGNSNCFGDRNAIVLPDAEITYFELWKKVSIAWTKIEALGLDRDKPVILLIDNPIRHTIIRLAMMCAGCCVAAIRAEHIPLVAQLKSDVIFYDAPNVSITNHKTIRISDEWFDVEERPIEYHRILRPERVGQIIFTSGSTGLPKAIATTYGRLERTIITAASCFIFPAPTSLILHGLSTNGYWHLFPILVGRSSAFFSPIHASVDLIRKHRIQEIRGTPAQILALARFCDEERTDVGVDRIVLGGAPVSAETNEYIIKKFKCSIINVFGSSETSAIAVRHGTLDGNAASRSNSFVPILDVEIVDDLGMPVPIGSVGRVKVIAPDLSRPFDGTLETKANSSVSDIFVSNDLGEIDAAGVLTLIGRADETINFGGAKFAPEVPEEIFKRHPLISDAGVVAIRKDNDLQEVWLALVAPHWIDVNLLNQWYAHNTSGELASMHFDRFILVDQIPRGFNGKVLRRQLREKLIAMRESPNAT